VNTSSKAAALTVAAALLLAGCGGGSKPSASKTGSSPSGTFSEPQMSPLPKVSPAQVKVLVGTWVNQAKNSLKDYFVFKADGTGQWIMQNKGPLWSGQVIPAGGQTFRLSWQGKDPNVSSFWAIKINSDGSLLFEGNQQKYVKGKP
jgi:hypothetical protein